MIKRTETADALKGIAILLMIQVHILELFAVPKIVESHLGKLVLFLGGPSVAPLFMVIFGYFLLSNQHSFKQLFVRGLKIFSLGMLLNIGLNFNLILSNYQGILNINIWPYVFGVDILQLAGISLIIIACIKPILQKNNYASLLLILTVILLTNITANLKIENAPLKYISAFIYGNANWSYFPIFPWLCYPLLGVWFYQLHQQFSFIFLKFKKIKYILYISFAFFLFETYHYTISITSHLISYYHHHDLFFLWVVMFLGFYTLLVNDLNMLVGHTMAMKFIKWLGQHVTLIYVIQWLIIGNIATEIYKTESNLFNLGCWFTGITIASCGLTYMKLLIKPFFGRK